MYNLPERVLYKTNLDLLAELLIVDPTGASVSDYLFSSHKMLDCYEGCTALAISLGRLGNQAFFLFCLNQMTSLVPAEDEKWVSAWMRTLHMGQAPLHSLVDKGASQLKKKRLVDVLGQRGIGNLLALIARPSHTVRDLPDFRSGTGSSVSGSSVYHETIGYPPKLANLKVNVEVATQGLKDLGYQREDTQMVEKALVAMFDSLSAETGASYYDHTLESHQTTLSNLAVKYMLGGLLDDVIAALEFLKRE